MSIDEAIEELEGHEGNIRFQRLVTICEAFYGKARIRGSHYICKTPWPGDPRINIQEAGGGKAHPYQVRQVIQALKISKSRAEQ
jgi:hypothetical protein